MRRPDLIDLIGAEFDRENARPATKTLIICSSPRTGSYELCRYLVAAGIGVPHEYFSPNYSRRLAERWGLDFDPISEEGLGRYLELLRLRRSANSVFATKIMFRQFDRTLKNAHGETLLDGATFVHTYRPDVVAQLKSLTRARNTGRYGYSEAVTQPPRATSPETALQQTIEDAQRVIEADAEIRRLFVYLGVRPIFVTTDEIFSRPVAVVGRIADAMSVGVDTAALERMAALGQSYSHGNEQDDDAAIRAALRTIAFRK